MSQQETFTIKDNNYVIKTEYEYIPNSVRASLSTGQRVIAQELGEQYISIDPSVGEQEVTIFYNTPVMEINESGLLRQKINELEKQVNTLTKKLDLHERALDNRVSVTTFQTWLKLVEKKAGIKLIDNTMGIVTTELYKN